MHLLGLDLCGDAHRDLIKFVLQSLNLLANVFDGALAGLLCKVLSMLVNDKVDFLGFAVVLLPAHLNVSFVVNREGDFVRGFFVDSLELCAVLGNLKKKRELSSCQIVSEKTTFRGCLSGLRSLTVKRISFSLTPVTV